MPARPTSCAGASVRSLSPKRIRPPLTRLVINGKTENMRMLDMRSNPPASSMLLNQTILERIEAGASAQMSNMIRILRVLDLLPGLDRMIPAELAGPIDLLKRKGKVRLRASSRRPDQTDEPWSWQDEP